MNGNGQVQNKVNNVWFPEPVIIKKTLHIKLVKKRRIQTSFRVFFMHNYIRGQELTKQLSISLGLVFEVYIK